MGFINQGGEIGEIICYSMIGIQDNSWVEIIHAGIVMENGCGKGVYGLITKV
jgi:hypothetical protein